ncbi:uncharacterized protein C8R40DRAFT_423244 [Lentinula edodes]|uniref:uncharacterized protein n=1 Tax=Lentinula edodes TaxID=5353 RepID=UPI001E8D28F4|nr:uncharacterized protein C8R40DRAFT_423244 [Lentinula edodes]KAH7872834.1 hypothetical protein C8R40DRAFT_423244 [Lentinula edodes]
MQEMCLVVLVRDQNSGISFSSTTFTATVLVGAVTRASQTLNLPFQASPSLRTKYDSCCWFNSIFRYPLTKNKNLFSISGQH